MLEAVLVRKIQSAELLNPGLPADVTHAKTIALDLRVILDDGTLVDVEMQARLLVHNRERFLYYSAREYASQLGEGEDYGRLHPAVSVLWLGESMFPELDQLHSVFELRERQTGALYSEHMELHVLQLAKLPFARQDEAQLQRWARFLAAQSDAEYAALARENPVMANATQALDALSEDPETQRLARDRADSEKLYAMSLRASREEGVVEGHQSGVAEGSANTLLKQLRLKFGELPPAVVTRVREGSMDELDAWAERVLFKNSLTDVLDG
jgi:predicted transposase/invertase (TIGR01784 family)